MKLVIKGILLFFVLFPSFVYSITVSEQLEAPVVVEEVQTEKDERVLLLSWQGDYLRTTAGTVHLKGVLVNNLTGLEPAELTNTKDLAEVILIHNGANIEQVDIVTAK